MTSDPDSGTSHFGSSDRQAIYEESAAADRTDDVAEAVREHYREMSSTGAAA